MVRLNRKYVCESSLQWILNYRMMQRHHVTAEECPETRLVKLILQDHHTIDSLNWTVRQSAAIDKLGWHQWFITTRGPKGFH
uniref:Uncharacterized protein n=1 Tax=viral metagenome TaxID=1070528 RepID=A0A6C0BLQ3_9ZZZZ